MDTIGPDRLQETAAFSRWFKNLRDQQARAAIALRLRHLASGYLGDVRSVGGGVFELRWHLGPGYRVYFCHRGDRIVLLLAGGDKSTQTRDIGRAQQLAKEIQDGQDP